MSISKREIIKHENFNFLRQQASNAGWASRVRIGDGLDGASAFFVGLACYSAHASIFAWIFPGWHIIWKL